MSKGRRVLEINVDKYVQRPTHIEKNRALQEAKGEFEEVSRRLAALKDLIGAAAQSFERTVQDMVNWCMVHANKHEIENQRLQGSATEARMKAFLTGNSIEGHIAEIESHLQDLLTRYQEIMARFPKLPDDQPTEAPADFGEIGSAEVSVQDPITKE